MPRPAPATDRTISVINLLAGSPNASFTLSDLSRRLNINKATVHPQLAALVQAGYLQRDPTSKTYSLGGALIAVGNAAGRRQFEVVEHARDEMISMAVDLGVQSIASARFGMEIVLLARAGRNGPFLSPEVARLPLVPPFGGVFMAWADQETLNEWIALVPADRRQDVAEQYWAAIASIQAHGYGVGLRPPDDRSRWQQSSFPAAAPSVPLLPSDYLLLQPEPDAEYAVNVIAAPVFGPDGGVVVALSLFDFPPVLAGTAVRAAAERLVQATRRVTNAIHGWSPLDDIGQSSISRLTI